MADLSCGKQDLVAQARIKPRSPALRVQSLSHWATREVPSFASELTCLVLLAQSTPSRRTIFRAQFRRVGNSCKCLWQSKTTKFVFMIQNIFIGPQTLGHSLGFPRKENLKQMFMHKHLMQNEIQHQEWKKGNRRGRKASLSRIHYQICC